MRTYQLTNRWHLEQEPMVKACTYTQAPHGMIRVSVGLTCLERLATGGASLFPRTGVLPAPAIRDQPRYTISDALACSMVSGTFSQTLVIYMYIGVACRKVLALYTPCLSTAAHDSTSNPSQSVILEVYARVGPACVPVVLVMSTTTTVLEVKVELQQKTGVWWMMMMVVGYPYRLHNTLSPTTDSCGRPRPACAVVANPARMCPHRHHAPSARPRAHHTPPTASAPINQCNTAWCSTHAPAASPVGCRGPNKLPPPRNDLAMQGAQQCRLRSRRAQRGGQHA